jgi:ABC-2 type transport system permease protein
VNDTVFGAQGWIFQRLRWRQFRNTSAQMFGSSRIRIVSIALCSLLVAGFVAGISWAGFHELAYRKIFFAGAIIGLLFDFLFLSLGVMLFFSTSIIVYSSLFHSPETAFLLSTPARADHVFAYKFQTAIAFSSWAFVLLGLPILLAYGVVYAVSWHFFVLLPLFLLGFVLLPAAAGSIACFAVVNFLPQRRRQILFGAGLLLLLAAGWWGYHVVRSSGEVMSGNRSAIEDLFDWLKFARKPYMPGHWMTRGLQMAASGDMSAAAMPLAMIWSNGLFAYLLATATSRWLYRRGFNRIATGSSLRKRYSGAWLDRAVSAGLWFLDPQTALLIIKDFRTFRRDPAQWAQLLIFLSLGLVYIVNSRQFFTQEIGFNFAQGVSLMNLCATAMLICAFMGRFVFPMMSLEGKKFWILGLLPMRRERLLWGKFYFSATGALVVAEGLVLAGDIVLGVGPAAIGLHVLTVAILALGLSGLSVGLGATMPNFRETDPSKIAVGFGGTLNLVAGLLYLLVVIGLMAGPYHFFLMFRPNPALAAGPVAVIATGVAAGLLVGLAAVVFPLRMGIRTLREMEF